MRWTTEAAALAALALAGCAANEAPPAGELPPSPEQGTCNAEGVQGLVGETATAQIGARIVAETGARTLRWGPPRSAFTMDYRKDRVNVMYDDAMVIEKITCG